MSILFDINYSLRMLFKTPKFTAMTLAVLIGGLSISLFTFSFLHTLVYKPLPIPEAKTAKVVNVVFSGADFGGITGYEFANVKDSVQSLDEFGIYEDSILRFTVGQSGKDIYGSYVQGGFFEFSRTKPILGRTINTNDTKIGASSVVVISHEFWQNELNGEPDILASNIILNGEITQVIGVMPKDYLFPNNSRLWLPLSNTIFSVSAENSQTYQAYGRVKSGISITQAESDIGQGINQIYQNNVKRYNLPELEKTVKITSFQIAQTGGQGTVVFIFWNIVSWMILLLACINVGNLLLARTVERQKETAIRAALGATTSRLVSLLMWEGAIVSILGGLLSILLVGAVLDYVNIVFHSWNQGNGSFWWRWGMDIPTLLMGLGFTLVTIILTGFIPAWRSANQDINEILRDGTRGAQSKKTGRITKFLVTTQIFLVATLMLIGSVIAYISYHLVSLDAGDDYTDVMLARITIPEDKYPRPEQQIAIFQALTEQIAEDPQVLGVNASTWQIGLPVMLEGVDYPSDASKPKIDVITLIGETTTVGIDLIAGRQFNHLDTLGRQKTALISQSMAKRYWPGQSPIGKQFQVEVDGNNETVSVVGVVTNRLNATALFSPLDSADEIYLSGLQFINDYQRIFYRTIPNAKDADEIFYRALYAVDRNIEVRYSASDASENRNKMRDVMGLTANITYGTGLFALILAMVGIYGLTSNSVARRTHEIGVRRAVGAKDKDITKLFLRQGAGQLFVALGLALGIFTLLSFGFHSFTEEIFPVYLYLVVAAPVVLGLTVVVMWAIYIPTQRAIMLEPSTALRYE